MPFRSEGEQLREQIRRVEEQTRELLEEQASLEQQVKAQSGSGAGRSLVGLLVAAVAVVATSFIGFETGALEAEKRGARRMEQVERDEVARLDVERARMNVCNREHEQATAEENSCRHDLARVEWRLRALTLPAPLAPQGGLR